MHMSREGYIVTRGEDEFTIYPTVDKGNPFFLNGVKCSEDEGALICERDPSEVWKCKNVEVSDADIFKCESQTSGKKLEGYFIYSDVEPSERGKEIQLEKKPRKFLSLFRS